MADKFRGTVHIPHLPLFLHSLLAPQTISAFVHDMTAHLVSPSVALPVENFISLECESDSTQYIDFTLTRSFLVPT